MEKDIAPFLRFVGENSLREGVPQLMFELYKCRDIDFNSRGSVQVKIRRVDNDSRPCIFYWSSFRDAFGPDGFLLFRHTPASLHPIQRTGGFVEKRPGGPLEVSLRESMLWELAPGGEIKTTFHLLPSFNKDMFTGETYEVVWPGNEVTEWNWGTKKEHESQYLLPKSPAICLPASWTTVFVKRECIWCNAPLLSPSKRNPQAPILEMFLQCEKKSVPLHGINRITQSVTYKAPPGSKPIVMYTHDLKGEVELYRRCGGTTWDDAETDPPCYAGLDFDGPDFAVSVVEHQDFKYMEPGETWKISTFSLNCGEYFDPDLASGDEIRCIYAGCEIFWWDWGTREEHADTVVTFSSTGLMIADPKDNNGRPALIVPASNAIEFSIVGDPIGYETWLYALSPTARDTH